MAAAVPLEGGAWPALRLEVRERLMHSLFTTVGIRCVLDDKVAGPSSRSKYTRKESRRALVLLLFAMTLSIIPNVTYRAGLLRGV